MSNKKDLQRLTLEQLIAKKIEKEKNEVKFKDIEVPSLGGTLLFEKPLEEDLFECMDSIDEDKSMKDIVDAYDILIYKCCPTLKDAKLQEEFNIKVPTDVVKKMFDVSDRMMLGDELVRFSGLDKLGDKIKK